MENEKKRFFEIHRYSKITLKADKKFKSRCVGEDDFIIPAGTYFISGFWVWDCGIAETLEQARNSDNKYLIHCSELTEFEEVDNNKTPPKEWLK